MKKSWIVFTVIFLFLYVLWLFEGDEWLGKEPAPIFPMGNNDLPRSDSSASVYITQFNLLLGR